MPSSNKKLRSEILEHIPHDELTREQRVHWEPDISLYKLSREPEYLFEFSLYGQRMIICHDNGTFTYISTHSHWVKKHCRYRSLHLLCGNDSNVSCNKEAHLKYTFLCEILGKTSDAIAETAALFWSLKGLDEISAPFTIVSYNGYFDFNAVKADHLVRIFEKNSNRSLHLKMMRFNAAQSRVLATRPDRIGLILESTCCFEDDGEAFIHALQNRQSSFGTFGLSGNISIIFKENLKRLLQLTTFDKLTLSFLPENLVDLPFSAPVRSLDYTINNLSVLSRQFEPLDIMAKELSLELHYDSFEFPTGYLLSFLRRVAQLGHFEGLAFDVRTALGRIIAPTHIARELIQAITANQKLTYLDLTCPFLYWSDHLEEIFKAMETHKGLRLFRIEGCSIELPRLKLLLSRNRRIQVDGFIIAGGRCKGERIEKIHQLNRFFCGSDSLVQEPPSTRPSLVGTTLLGCASGNFQRSALLLVNHTDTLCELMHGAAY